MSKELFDIEELYNEVKDLPFLDGLKILNEHGYSIVKVDDDKDSNILDIYFIYNIDNYLEFVAGIEARVGEGEGSCDISEGKLNYDVKKLYEDTYKLNFTNGHWKAVVDGKELI